MLRAVTRAPVTDLTAETTRSSDHRRVLLAHPSPDLYGSDRMLVESVRALCAGGAEVTVAVPQDGPLVPLLRSAGAQVLLVETVVLRKAFLRPGGLLTLAGLAARTLIPMVRAVRRTRADLVYVNTLTLPGWLLAARLAGRPALCHVHEAEDGIGRLVGVGLHAPLLLAGRVLVNSASAERGVVAALPLLGSRVRLLYNGVQGPDARPAPPREQLTDPVRLVLVGRLSPRKGTDVAVRAVAELREAGVDAVLDLVGEVFPGYEWFAQQLRSTAAELGVEDRVHFSGFRDDVWPALRTADVVLVPSRVEPFGNVAVEAALARRPVVASAVQGLTEIVQHGATGLLVPPDDPGALSRAVQRLVQDWPAACALADRAEHDAHERFSPASYAEALRHAVRGAAREARGPRAEAPARLKDGVAGAEDDAGR